MPKRGKRYRGAAAQKEIGKAYDLKEAVELLGSFPKSKFDETVEISLLLGIDPKKSDQMVRGSISLPNGIGKELRVIAFAEGEKADAAREAGAIEVGSADLAKKIQDGWMDFDVAVASPDMMKHVGRLGKILGPQGKMPSPKAGTVTPDLATAVGEFKAGKIELRNDEGGNVAAPMGRRSFEVKALCQNVQAFIDFVSTLRPAAAKGIFVKKATLSATHSPGIPLQI